MNKKNIGSLNAIRKQMQITQLIFIFFITVLLSGGGAFISISSAEKDFSQNLQNTSSLITRLYNFTKGFSQEELCAYMLFL